MKKTAKKIKEDFTSLKYADLCFPKNQDLYQQCQYFQPLAMCPEDFYCFVLVVRQNDCSVTLAYFVIRFPAISPVLQFHLLCLGSNLRGFQVLMN